MLLPELLPRIGYFFASGMAHISYYIAVLYSLVRLLPIDHPYLDPGNIGRFGVRQVVGEAYRNVHFDRHHVDQIFVFFLVLIGLVAFVLQIVLAVMAIAAQPVYAAAGVLFAEFFTLSNTHTHYQGTEEFDIALMTLDRIFGVKGIFNSCVSTAVNCVGEYGEPIPTPGTYPWPIHKALHGLFRFYSVGIGIISLIIILYYITTIIGETAVTGTPFGQRFNKAWAPVRFIAFFALLAPLNIGGQNAGLNGAQLITLWTAKFGSNFASNAWGAFNNTLEDAVGERILYERDQLIAVPNAPKAGNILQFMTVMQVCSILEDSKMESGAPSDKIKAFIVKSRGVNGDPADAMEFWNKDTPTFKNALAFNGPGNMHIVFGRKDPQKYGRYPGAVRPLCGELVLPISADLQEGRGAYEAHNIYYLTVAALLSTGGVTDLGVELHKFAKCFAQQKTAYEFTVDACNSAGASSSYADFVKRRLETIATFYDVALQVVVQNMQNDPDFVIGDKLLHRGWGAAAVWYNRLAYLNGDMVSGLFSKPQVKLYPEVMEITRKQQVQHSESITGPQQFAPTLPNNKPVTLPGESKGDTPSISAYYGIYKFWDNKNLNLYIQPATTFNPVIDTINAVFGTEGLFDMRNTHASSAIPDNQDVHPLALLSAMGKSLVEASVRNLAIAAGGAIGGGALSIVGTFTAGQGILEVATSFFKTVGTATLLIGVMLYYVLPFLPFIYFFFALGHWVKSIFEAMVAMPIWALAHLRIDGEGLPGPGATNGYYLLLEIFIRPVLILVGLLGSVTVFAALVQQLNEIFAVVTDNAGGSAIETAAGDIDYYRGPIDILFYTILYTAIVYMLGLSCFKLIDQVPDNILRWLGVSVSPFQDNAGDPASQFTSSVYRGGNLAIGQASGLFQRDPGKAAAIIESSFK